MRFSTHMQAATFRFVLNLILAVLLFLSEEWSRFLGIKILPLALSSIWPATGISLAALLLFGFRAWPGVFLGNFSYNFYHLMLHASAILSPFVAALSITLGSLSQALLGAYIMRRLSSKAFFDTVNDIIIFLIGGGLLTCIIGATVAVATFYFYGTLHAADFYSTWTTMWLGDSMGVYVFTPLIVRWTLRKPPVFISKYNREVFYMLLAFILLSVLFAVVDQYPAIYLFIPLSLWVTYRFRIHGATIVTLLISSATVVLTLQGYGSFHQNYTANPYQALAGFQIVLVMVTLLLAAVLNERDAAWDLVQVKNITIEEAVRMHLAKMKEVGSEMLLKQKLSVLSTMTSAMASILQNDLKKMSTFTKAGMDIFNQITNLTAPHKANLEPEIADKLDVHYKDLQKQLHGIGTLHARAQDLTKHMGLSSPERLKIESINLNALIDKCVTSCMTEMSQRHPDFSCTLVKELNSTAGMLLALPEDLARAFTFYLNHAISSMKEKSDDLGTMYAAILEVRTADQDSTVEITIRHNGIAVSEPELSFFSQSLVNLSEKELPIELDPTLAHDIIVLLHNGKINVSSNQGEFTQVSITIPK